jgi:3-oxoacyl-[acyl-carrier protein] reductase
MTAPRTAIVTGSSSGIGLAIAQGLLDAGWLVRGFDIAPPRLTEPTFTHVGVNLSDAQATDAATREHADASALIHAAGVLRVGKLGELNADDAQLMWQLHVNSISRIANIVVPQMASSGFGRVVIVGSRIARGLAGRGQYAATKAALVTLARSWAAEVVAQGVTINVVSPAATETSMLDDPWRGASAPRVPPIGRLIQPYEVASLVNYLLSPAAAAITGQDIQICGGASLQQ